MRLLPGRWIAVILLLSMWQIGVVAPITAQEPISTPEASPSANDTEGFEAPRFSIFPAGDFENRYFEVTLDAGDTLHLTAGIRNSGTVPASLRTYAANAYNPDNGGFGPGTDEEEPRGATLWVDYPSESLELQPGGEHELEFTITVPADTSPGEYVVALVVQTNDSLEIPGSESFRQIIRNSVSVEITVPGEMTSGFELGTPDVFKTGDQWVLDVPITNTGTARVRPQGELVVTTTDGQAISTTPVEMGSVYGGNSTHVRAFLPGHLPLGNYFVSLSLIDDATGARASITEAVIMLAEPAIEEDAPPVFVVDQASITPNGEPVQYADVAATITNNGSSIPTANVTLNVQRDGEGVESYPLAQNQALPQGSTDFSQRYIPVNGWQEGTYTFELVISAVSGGTETILATIDIEDEIVVP